MNNLFPRYPTIRQEAKHGNTTSERKLREMLAKNQLPGFYSGKTFRVNHEMLVRLLEEMSAQSLAPSEAVGDR